MGPKYLMALGVILMIGGLVWHMRAPGSARGSDPSPRGSCGGIEAPRNAGIVTRDQTGDNTLGGR